ncbi:MAG TPA: sulfatase-like hydrolase/transferase [Vicinamibacterales bacterium]|jgi:arylsulfatase A-like enzyme/Flp pilus assembly protein TadD
MLSRTVNRTRSGRAHPDAAARTWRWPLVALLGIGALSVIGVAPWLVPILQPGSGRASTPSASRLNVLLVTLDTTRADHLGCYGFARARTRHLDQLAAEGVRFEYAFSPAPITLPAHASILTGLYPFHHGVRNNGNFYLGERFDTLATVLHARGYRTAAFVSSFILDRRYGLARGFDLYDDKQEGASTQVISLEAERRGDRTALALTAWLDAFARQADGSPFFAWLHLYDPHEPYHPPPPFREAFADAPYDGEIAFDDAVIASVMERLDQLGLRDRTLVAIIGDHGESLGDHGEETHSMFVYESAIRVPFILWRPGLLPPARVVSTQVRATDLAPTILDVVGAPALKTDDGRSLRPLIEGRDPAAAPVVYAETFLPQFYMSWAPLRAVRDERWKYIEAPRPELYDLATDAAESQNRIGERAQAAQALKQQLDRLTGGVGGEMTPARMDREALEKLASLGYVGAGAEPVVDAVRQQKADPKDMIAVFNRLRRANSAVRERRFADALPILRDVLAQDPANAFAQLVLGSAHMGMGEYRQAIAQYRRYLELVPTSAYAHHWIAICALRMGDQGSALREAEATLAIDARFTDARIMKGGILASRGEYVGALVELRAAVAADPAKPMIRLDLAKVLAEAGQSLDAQIEYETLLKLQPDYEPALTGLGVLYAKRGRMDDAASALQRAVELQPGDNEARFNLGLIYERQGKSADARAEYARIAASPDATVQARTEARRRINALRPGT